MWILPLFFFYFIAATFKEMFVSMGAGLPPLTLIALKPWFGPLLGIVSAGIFSLQWVEWFHKRLLRRRLIVVLCYIIVSVFDAVCVIVLYLPIFKMAQAIGE
jgi:type II secretory pathway component PulF